MISEILFTCLILLKSLHEIPNMNKKIKLVKKNIMALNKEKP